ncbi:unnamed protein product [Lupinus luteus]|uniref:Uncharacterized protein n=1 Tax=Lupinus luteus TaxID=3873 RepID=A0AAV1WYC8_LUPLU
MAISTLFFFLTLLFLQIQLALGNNITLNTTLSTNDDIPASSVVITATAPWKTIGLIAAAQIGILSLCDHDPDSQKGRPNHLGAKKDPAKPILIGFCDDGTRRFLVSEFMSNALADILFGQPIGN